MRGGGVVEPPGGMRAFDPFRDMARVVEMIELAFGNRLDPAGQATLERMRRFASRGALFQWAWALLGRTTIAPGLVWEANGRVVGNVSLRRARSADGYLIGNVVVHPDYQGQGIGSALMREAIRIVSRRGARWVGLEVHAGNHVARGLYERLGFQEVGRTIHLLRPRGVEWVPEARGPNTVRRGQRRDGEALMRLVEAVIPAKQRPLLEIHESEYRPSWKRRVAHWLRGEDEIWWVCPSEAELWGATRVVQKRGAFPNCMEVLVREKEDLRLAIQLVRQGISSLRGSGRKAIESRVPENASSLTPALKQQGFEELRILIHMERILKHRIPVREG